MNVTEFVIVVAAFAAVSVLGFWAHRWRRSSDVSLEQWALAGRGFRSWVSWFVIGGDLYTAYTYVAVPALLFGAGRSASTPCPTSPSSTRSSS